MKKYSNELRKNNFVAMKIFLPRLILSKNVKLNDVPNKTMGLMLRHGRRKSATVLGQKYELFDTS